MSFPHELYQVLDTAKEKLEAEGHVAAEAIEERLQELKPLLVQDEQAAEAAALALVKKLFGDEE